MGFKALIDNNIVTFGDAILRFDTEITAVKGKIA